MTRGLALKVDVNEKVIQEIQKVAHENGECLDKDVRTLHGSSCRHRKELDAYTEALNKMEEQIEGLCRVFNKQMQHIRDLWEMVEANNNIITNQQDWITKMRGATVTGGKGSFTQRVHCEYIGGSETICPDFTQQAHARYF